MPAILKLKDSQGKIYTVPAIRGKDGKNIKAGKHLLLNEKDEMSVDVSETLSDTDDRPIAGNAVKKKTDELESALARAFDMCTGSYTGTGGYGEQEPTSLTFSLVPKFAVISKETPDSEALVWMEGMNGFSGGGMSVSLAERTLSFFHTESAALQYNEKDTVYRYTVFGTRETPPVEE